MGLLLLLAAASPFPPFTYTRVDSKPNTGSSCCLDVCALGDIDGDGKIDIVIGAQKSKAANLVWYQWPKWTKRAIAQGNFTTDGKCGDVDGDGDVDVIICDYGKGIYWFENPNNLGNTSWKAHKIDGGYAHDLEVGDLNGDGRLDVVTDNKRDIIIYIQNSSGGFARRLLMRIPGEGMDLADMDRDGDLDICYGASWIEQPKDFLKDKVNRYVVGNFPAYTKVRAGDMDKDGDLDLVLTTSESAGPVKWLEAPTNPKLGGWKSHEIVRSLDRAHSLQLGDLDGDGRLDLATAQMHTSKDKLVLVFLQDGKGGFRRIALAETGSHNLQLGDIAGDGDLDLVGKNYAGPERYVEIWVNHMIHRGQ